MLGGESAKLPGDVLSDHFFSQRANSPAPIEALLCIACFYYAFIIGVRFVLMALPMRIMREVLVIRRLAHEQYSMENEQCQE